MKQLNELGLEEFDIFNVEEHDGITYYDVTPKELPRICPRCGSTNVVFNGSFTRVAQDLNLYEKPVAIVVTANRIRCKDCGTTTTPSFDIIDDRDKITKRLKNAIKEECLVKGVKEIAETRNVSVATVERIIDEVVDEKNAEWITYVPNILGLFKIMVGKKNRILCIDVEKSGVIDLLEDDSYTTITNYLSLAKDHIPEFTIIDFNVELYRIVDGYWRNANIVVSPVYFSEEVLGAAEKDLQGRHVNKATKTALLTRESKVLSEQVILIQDVCAKDEYFEKIYIGKECLLDIVSPEMITDASEALRCAGETITEDCVNLQRVLDRIYELYPAIFEQDRTEAVNREIIAKSVKLVKTIQKKGSGYSFKNLRARLLFVKDKKEKKGKVRKPVYAPKNPGSTIGFATPFKDPTKIEYEIVGYKDVIGVVGTYVDMDELLDTIK